MDKMSKQPYVYLVFPSHGGTATEHQAHKAVVEDSGVLALYTTDENGSDVLVHAFNQSSWHEIKRMPVTKET